MANFYGATSLTGGGTGALDALDGNDLSDGDGAVVIIDGTFYIYHLDASSGASESSPFIITPDSNPGNKRWILSGRSGMFYTDIGDIAAAQYDEGDLTLDNNWNDLDLSSHIGVGLRLVHFRVSITDNSTGIRISLRTNGNSYSWNTATVRTQSSNVQQVEDCWVWTDSNGVIEYVGTAGTDSIDISIRGYFSY